MERSILHVDANSFYASVECLCNPEIRNLPVAVVGNVEKRHGIVLTANYIAKRNFGVKTGDIIWEAKRKCPRLVVREVNMPLYIKFSELMHKILLRYSDRVESFGTDEAWIDVTHSAKIFGSGMDIAKQIKEQINNELGITVSIGVSFNKIFAKLGSDYRKPDAITEISRDNFKEIVWPLRVSDLLLVGKQTTKKLLSKNISTIGELANTDRYYLKEWLGKHGLILHDFANGIDNSKVSLYSEKNTVKSVGNSTTTPRDLKNNEDVKMIMYVLADSVSRRLRKKGLYGNVISISVKNNQMSYFTRQIKIDEYTNLSLKIATEAFELFTKNYNWSHPIRALGITVSNLSQNKGYEQMSIYHFDSKEEELLKLENVQDDLKRRFGSFCVQRGVLLKDINLTRFAPDITHTVHPISYQR